MYRCIIFDLDGTLVDTLEDISAACNHALQKIGASSHSKHAIMKMIGNGIPKLIERMLPLGAGDEAKRDARSFFEEYYLQHMCDKTAPYPGIPGLLEELKARGILLAIASNKKDKFTREISEHYFPGIFSAVIGQRTDFPPKPDPACVIWLMQQLEAAPATTLYVGDSDVDMHTAENAGLPGCGVLWGFRSEANLRNAGANYIAANTAELRTLILSQ